MGKDGKQCEFCSTTTTPIWRRGPSGKGTLCNACGVKWGLRQRQSMGFAKKRSNKKPKAGQMEPLFSGLISPKPQTKSLPTRRTKDAALLQFLEFEKNSSLEESPDGFTPINSPDSEAFMLSEEEPGMNLLEHLLFVAESKFMKERELAALRTQLTALQDRILAESYQRSQAMQAAILQITSQCERELSRHRESINQHCAAQLQDLPPLLPAASLGQAERIAEETLAQTHNRFNTSALAAHAELTQILSVLSSAKTEM